MTPPPLPAPLIAPDEPPAVEVVNGRGRAPVLLVVDHAGRRFPRALGTLGVTGLDLERHIAWDIGAAAVARHLAERFDAPAVLATYSRLVIDPNRPLSSPTLIPEESDGTPVPGNIGLTPAQRQARIETFHAPYHATVAEIIAGLRARGTAPAVLSIHSCTPVMNGFHRPWHVGVLWNRDPRIAVPLMEMLAAGGDVCVGDNEPYSARTGHGHTIETHATPAGLPTVMVEVRQDLIGDEAGAAHWAGRLARPLEPILSDPALYRAERY
ncbi:MAG TPA: N-formylglutamate amidohydrolase [Azospirillaceae bacterium]|nr:N-formylglutamate amidohydrolase [Azospirillaceae bacterium]